MNGRTVVMAAATVLAGLALGACATPVAGIPRADPHAAPAPRATPTPGATPAAPAPGVAPVVVDPLIPGWSSVRAVKRGALYDVPPGWTVRSEGTLIGFEEPNSTKARVISGGAAETGIDYCGPNSYAAAAVVRPDSSEDLAGTSTNNAEAWADAAYRDPADAAPTLTVHPPETVTTMSGQKGVLVQVDARMKTPSAQCHITAGKAYAITAAGYHGENATTATLVVYTDVGTPGEVPDATIRQILGTLRPVEQK